MNNPNMMDTLNHNQSTEKMYFLTASKRPLAPMPTPTNCKRKIQFVPTSNQQQQQPASVARRNARERNRVKQVNNGFAALRQHIPANVLASCAAQQQQQQQQQPSPSQGSRGASKKLSKVETLRLAVEYIRSLQQMLDDNETEMKVGNGGAMGNENYYVGSSEAAGQYAGYPIILPTPPSSEASVSPTPSQTSEASTPSYTSVAAYKPYANYESYGPNSPEDEELLDAIFSWQHTP